MEPGDRLESWKEIAAYLNRDVRTVQRWEASEGLPVHRHQHRKRGSVHAFRSELDEWRRSRLDELFADPPPEAPPRPARRSRPAAATVVAVLVALLAVSWALLRRPPVESTPGLPSWEAPRILAEAMREGASIERVPIGATVQRLLPSPDGRSMFVEACDESGVRVQAVDLASRAIAWRVDVGAGGACGPLALAPQGDVLVLGDLSDVVAIDVATRSTRRIRTPVTAIRDLAVAPDNRTVYLAAVFQGLLALDLGTGASRVITELPCPVQLALDGPRGRLYVGYQCSGPGGRRGHDAIEVFDTASTTSVATITGLPNVSGDLLLTPDGRQLWADAMNACVSPSYDHAGCPSPGGVVNVIRAHDRMLLRSIPLGTADNTVGLSVTPDGSRVVASRLRTTVVSTGNLAEVEASRLPIWSNVAFSSDGATAYAALGDARSIAILPVRRRLAPPPGLTTRWTLDGMGRDSAGARDLDGLTDEAFAPGRVGGALRFPVEPEILLRDLGNLDIDRGQFTALAWVKLAPGPFARVEETILEYAVEAPQGTLGWRAFIEADGRPAMCLGLLTGNRCAGPGVTVLRGQPLTAERWHHIAVRRSDRTLALIVDGRVEATGEAGETPTTYRPLWLRVGSNEAGGAPLAGLLDEVEFYNRALTQQELAERGK